MRRLLFSVLLVLTVIPASAQISRGTVQEGLTVESRILGKPVRYTVYLPYDYHTSTRYYPVVYLLHGYTDNDTGWLQFGEAHMIADELINDREIPPMIIVMPDAGVSWYVNNFDASVRYEDFFIDEFIPHIEAQYRVRREKRYRAVSGLSMGGYGTLIYALHHPDLFAAAAPLSAAVFTEDEMIGRTGDQWAQILAPVFGPDRGGQARLTEHYRANSPLDIIRTGDPEEFRKVRWYIDCGDDDFLARGNSALHVLMLDKEIPHEYRVRNGGHSWSYWRTGLPDALRFIGVSFHQ